MAPFETHSDQFLAKLGLSRRVVEITGHLFAPHRAELVDWYRRVGLDVDEGDAIVREYREHLDQGMRAAHPHLR